MSYEGLDDMEELQKVLVVINNNNVNVVSDSKNDSSKDDFENDNDNFFDENIHNQVKATPKPLSTQSGMSHEKAPSFI